MRAVRAESVWAALGGVLAGYVLWLVAFSIGDFLTTAGRVGSDRADRLGGVRAGRGAVGTAGAARGNLTLAAFALASPVLPVLLSLLVVADSYL